MMGRLGKYRIEREIGRGATGVVYLGHDDELNRRVAIKVLEIPDTVQGADRREMIERFRREARAAAAVSHPNVAAIYEVGTQGDTNYIAMEYCEGPTVRDMLSMQGPFSKPYALNIAGQVLDALQAAHDAGIYHRDIKPDNIVVSPKGVVKVTDFGIARAFDDIKLTRTGTMVGTPAYMSPEQILGKPTDHRTDIFSVGILLHEMLTGRRPFEGSTITEITHSIAYEEPKLSPTLGPPLDAVIAKALSKEPENRFQSAREMSLAIQGKVPVQMQQAQQASYAQPQSAQYGATIVGTPPAPAPPQPYSVPAPPQPYSPNPPMHQPAFQVPPSGPDYYAAAQQMKDYFVEAILVTLFCCLPAGIVAIIYAYQARSKISIGDYFGATQAANAAKTWVGVSFVLGLLLVALLVLSDILTAL